MIHIIENYYVDVNDDDYAVCIKKQVMRNGTETTVFKPVHYFGSLKGAVKDIGELYRRDKLSETDISLIEAIKILQTADNALESVLYRALGEK